MRQQPGRIDALPGRESGTGGDRHRIGNAPVAAAIGVARGRLVARGGAGRRRQPALRIGQAGVGPADGLEAFHAELATHRGHAEQRAEGTCLVGPAAHQRAARRGLFAGAVPIALQLVGQMRAGPIERPRAAHVHHAGHAAFEHARGGRLAHRQLGEELGREQIQVHFAVLVLRVDADRGSGDAGAVERGLGEAGAQAADGDIQPFAVDVARELHAGDAVERLGDVHVRELADVLGEHGIAEGHRIALGIGGELDTAAVTGDIDRIQLLDRIVAGRCRRRCRLRRRGCLRPGAASGHAQQCGGQCMRQRGARVTVLHRDSPQNR